MSTACHGVRGFFSISAAAMTIVVTTAVVLLSGPQLAAGARVLINHAELRRRELPPPPAARGRRVRDGRGAVRLPCEEHEVNQSRRTPLNARTQNVRTHESKPSNLFCFLLLLMDRWRRRMATSWACKGSRGDASAASPAAARRRRGSRCYCSTVCSWYASRTHGT